MLSGVTARLTELRCMAMNAPSSQLDGFAITVGHLVR
jgi:hypothetical protein